MSEKKVEDHVIMLRNVRAAFLQIWEPDNVQGEGKKAFSGTFLMAPGDPNIVLVQEAITAVAVAKWGDEASEILAILIASDKVCLHNGDTKANYDGFKGNMFVSARSPSRPGIFAADRSILVEADGKPYSGCYVNAQIALWAQQNNFGKRVNAQLRGVQFLRDGDAFGGGAVAQADEFDVVEGADADGAAPAATAAAWGAPAGVAPPATDAQVDAAAASVSDLVG